MQAMVEDGRNSMMTWCITISTMKTSTKVLMSLDLKYKNTMWLQHRLFFFGKNISHLLKNKVSKHLPSTKNRKIQTKSTNNTTKKYSFPSCTRLLPHSKSTTKRQTNHNKHHQFPLLDVKKLLTIKY